jgi:hypothetical protein
MKNNTSKSKAAGGPITNANSQPGVAVAQPECPEPEAFLVEAKKESKRKLLADHERTIVTLRDEKRFTFREIAEWFNKRGIETDHSAVYRVYLASIPVERRNPNEDWSDVDEPE